MPPHALKDSLRSYHMVHATTRLAQYHKAHARTRFARTILCMKRLALCITIPYGPHYSSCKGLAHCANLWSRYAEPQEGDTPPLLSFLRNNSPVLY
jgi:hypothetical protein